jgi:hypothetical protein
VDLGNTEWQLLLDRSSFYVPENPNDRKMGVVLLGCDASPDRGSYCRNNLEICHGELHSDEQRTSNLDFSVHRRFDAY